MKRMDHARVSSGRGRSFERCTGRRGREATRLLIAGEGIEGGATDEPTEAVVPDAIGEERHLIPGAIGRGPGASSAWG